MSDDGKVPATIGGVPLGIVRGGTTSSTHDRRQHEAKVAAEAGRRKADDQNRAARFGSGMTQEGFVSARLHSLRMMDRGAPQLVLYYMNRDKTVKQECVSEVFVADDGDSGFTMVCPRCLERGDAMGLSQMKVMNSHRAFHIDQRRNGEMVDLVDPFGKPFHVRICGTVTCDDEIKCDNCGNFAVRIEDSKVWEV
jgi:hypothetical protein